MKRALLVVALLAAALIGLLLRFQPDRAVLATAPAPELPPASAPTAELEGTPTAARAARESLGPPAQAPAIGPGNADPAFVGPPAPPAALREWVTVRVQLRFADTHEPVSDALGLLSWNMDEVRGRGATLESLGRGVFAAGAPAGAHLSALQANARPELLAGPTTPDNAAGRFRPLAATLDQIVEQSDVEITLDVERARDLRGLVRDARTLQPLAGAAVALTQQRNAIVTVSTSRDGRFVLGDAAPGLELRVEHDGYSRLYRPLADSDLAPGAPELELPLQRGLCVRGRVIDKSGAARAGLRLRLSTLDRAQPEFETRTAEDGSFGFEELPPCAGASLGGSANARFEELFLGAPVDLGALREDVTNLVLVDPETACIQVFVHRASGAPADFWSRRIECDQPYRREDELRAVGRPYMHVQLDPSELKAVSASDDVGVVLRVPVGVPLHLRAIETPDPAHPERIAVGEKELLLDRACDPPLDVYITLGSVFDSTPPPPVAGAATLALFDSGATAALDLQLLDPQGNPLPAGTRASLDGLHTHANAVLAEGWVRLVSRPGRAQVAVRAGKLHGTLQLEFPGWGISRERRRLEEDP